ncbi:MAG: membrane associated rhomboid family serine protease [Myxococcota bacterium]|jgi:membrane associated rhomboid family serine protease
MYARRNAAGRAPSPGDPRSWPVVWQLMAVNVLVYVLWQMPGLRWLMVDHFMVSAESVFGLRLWTLITSAFSQYSSGHLFSNLLGIYFFGTTIEAVRGRRAVLELYLGGALAAGVAHVLGNLALGSAVPALGASGAVMALGGAFAAQWPNRKFLIYFLVPMPAWVMITLYAALDLTGMLGGVSDGIAHMAHLGGLAFGLLWVWRKGWWPRARRASTSW